MKKRKILLGFAMAAMAALSLSACDDANAVISNGNTQETVTEGSNESGTGSENSGSTSNNQNQTSGDNTTGNNTSGNNGGGEGKSQNETGFTDVNGNGQFTNESGKIEITSAVGDLEAAYVTYNEYANATSYNAYVKADSASTYTKIDSQLTRKYKDGNKTYMRTDVVGLKAGKYSIKVVPVINNSESEEKATIAKDINVVSHIRDGFGFVNGSSSGAYNDDGTLKSNADVIYVADFNKDTVKYSGKDSKGNVVDYVGIQNIITGLKGQKTINKPICIRFIGNILDPATLQKGDLYIDGAKDLTIEGIGNDATMNGFGIVIKGSSNIEIRNLGFMNCNSNEGDDCGLQQDNNHVWVHNCDFFYGDAGSDADQAKGDGALDTKKSTYVTHSYNHFFDNGKCNLQGMKSETAENYITYHHNWYDHSDSRHPRVRTCTVHIYNNYFDGNAKYGIASALGASIFAENNYFRSTSNTIPFMTGLMAHDKKEEGGNTLSGEAGGVIKEYGNVFEGTFRYTKYSDNNNDFDAYNASSRSEIVPSTVKSPANVPYNNFDTASTMYSYTLHTPEDAKASILKYAGRIDGGDFHWTFSESDDASYSVNTGLKAALVSYSSKLLAVQDLGTSTQGGSTVVTPDPVVTGNTAADVVELIAALPEASAVQASDSTKINAAKTAYDALDSSEKANVTNYSKLQACLAALSSLPQSEEVCTFPYSGSFFKVSGNTSTSKGKVTYNGTTYETCLKMEGSTTITFTTTADTTLTVVFGETDNANIKVNGTKKSADNNRVLTITLTAGSYTLAKGDSANVFYISVK